MGTYLSGLDLALDTFSREHCAPSAGSSCRPRDLAGCRSLYGEHLALHGLFFALLGLEFGGVYSGDDKFHLFQELRIFLGDIFFSVIE